jgi:hypothetical protein
MPNPNDEPLIYTSLGNVPVSSLEHYVQWTQTPPVNPKEITFSEIYKDKATGEIVKQSGHVFKINGPAPLGAEQAKLA